MSSEHLSNAPQRQTTVTKTTITTITTTTTTTETQTISPSPESNFPANNVPSSEPSHGHSPTTTRTSISSDASHPDDLRMPLHNERVDGFFVVLTGRVPGIHFSRWVVQPIFYRMLTTWNNNCRKAASANGVSYRKYKTWQAAYTAYLKAYFDDKVHATVNDNYVPARRRPSPSAGEREAMFWESVDRLPRETSPGENNTSVDN